MADTFYWRRTEKGEAALLRAFGQESEVLLPAKIEGLALTEIGAYCFAESRHLPEQYEVTETVADSMTGELRELSGRYITKIVLPDTVQKIGNLAFYHCKSLHTLEIGSAVRAIGSDVFMNCGSLHRIILHCGSRMASGLRQILAQFSSEIEVVFVGESGVEAKLLFPEYYESYDEIAPAHLFGRNIEGEGFRARQCFKDGVVDFAQYDRIFPKARAEESDHTLCRLAVNRLQYPVELREEQKKLYADYIREHAAEVLLEAVKKRDKDTAEFLCEQRLLVREALQEGIRAAAEREWAEGTAHFLRLMEQYFPVKTAEERYSFDDL